MRIVIVEDEKKVRVGMAAMIASHTRHTVAAEAANGNDGLEKIIKLRPDLVITDIRMPVMDGLDATRGIRALNREDSASVPILAMTANAFEEDRKKAFEASMNGYLVKPLDITMLISELEKAIGK